MELATLRTDARYIISPQLTSTEYPDVDLDRHMNIWYKKILSWVIQSQGDWEINGDVLYEDLAAAQSVYELPANLVRVYKGEVMYSTGGVFVPLNFYSVQGEQRSAEGNTTRIFDDSSNPTAELYGNNIEIRPAPTTAVANGIKLWAQLSLADLDATNNVPDFLEPVHRIISLGGALEFAVSQGMDKKVSMINKQIFGDPSLPDNKGYKGELEFLYQNRRGTQRSRLIARNRTSFK